MTSLLPADGLHRLGIVVNNYRVSMKEFTRFFGIQQWEIRRIDERRLSGATRWGSPARYSYISAIGSAGGVVLELVEPLSDNSIFAESLRRRGEGMHHLLTTVCSVRDFELMRPNLAASGIEIAQSGTIDNGIVHHFLETGPLLAGAVVQVVCTQDAAGSSAIKADETVQFDEEITAWNRLPIQKLYHACIVTKGRREQVRDSLQAVLGIDKWFNFANESDVTAVDTSLYGKPCKIAFNLSLGRRNTLCLEVVEEVYGRSIYTEFLEKQGEGLQHLMSTVCSEQEFEERRGWLESEGMPLIMGGRGASRDFCYYGYIDTRSRLAGITVEFLCPAGESWLKGRADVGEILIG